MKLDEGRLTAEEEELVLWEMQEDVLAIEVCEDGAVRLVADLAPVVAAAYQYAEF